MCVFFYGCCVRVSLFSVSFQIFVVQKRLQTCQRVYVSNRSNFLFHFHELRFVSLVCVCVCVFSLFSCCVSCSENRFCGKIFKDGRCVILQLISLCVMCDVCVCVCVMCVIYLFFFSNLCVSTFLRIFNFFVFSSFRTDFSIFQFSKERAGNRRKEMEEKGEKKIFLSCGNDQRIRVKMHWM